MTFSDTGDIEPSSYAISPTRYHIVLWSLTITFSAYLKLRFSSWFHVEISSWNSEQLCETWDICANSECCAPWLIMIPPTHNHLTFINDWNCLMWFKSRGGHYSIPGEKPPQPATITSWSATQDLSQFLLCTSILNFTSILPIQTNLSKITTSVKTAASVWYCN